MKQNLFTKIEDKIYFKVTTVFWHILIGIGALAIVVGIAFILWNYLPTSKQEVIKQPFPEKQKYPSAVTVSYNELNDIITMLNEERKQIKTTQIETSVSEQPTTEIKSQATQPTVIKDIQGEKDFKAAIERLRKIIPPKKYATLWNAKGFYSYPDGEAYWKRTHNEAYRHFNETQPGLEDRLIVTGDNYSDRKKLVDGYIIAITSLTEELRPIFLEFLMSHRNNDIDKTIALAQALAKIFPALQDVKSDNVLESLVWFNQRNPNDGIPFIEYTGTILGKFSSKIRDKIIYILQDNYDNNLQSQIEATDLFLPMINKFDVDVQAQALQQYYRMYVGKNISRASEIAQIDQRYIGDTMQINKQYEDELFNAQVEYNRKEQEKVENRNWWYKNIGIGILVIILISNILVIFNMQRTLRRIDEKMGNSNSKL